MEELCGGNSRRHPEVSNYYQGTSKRTLLEVGICQVYQEKTFWGERTIIDLVEDGSRSCVNERAHERLIGYFGRIEERGRR